MYKIISFNSSMCSDDSGPRFKRARFESGESDSISDGSWDEEEELCFGDPNPSLPVFDPKVKYSDSFLQDISRRPGSTPFMKLAILHKGIRLKFASEELKGNREFVLEVLEKCARAFRYISTHLKQDEGFILDAIRNKPEVFNQSSIPSSIKKDLSFIQQSICRNGSVIKYIESPSRLLVLAAVTVSGTSLKYATGFQTDRDIVLAALNQDPKSYQFVSPDLHEDPEVILASLQHTTAQYMTSSIYSILLKKQQAFQGLTFTSVKSASEELLSYMTYIKALMYYFKKDSSLESYNTIINRVGGVGSMTVFAYIKYESLRNISSYPKFTVESSWVVGGLHCINLRNLPQYFKSNDSFLVGHVQTLQNRDLARFLVSKNPMNLQYLGDFRSDLAIVQLAVSKQGVAIRFSTIKTPSTIYTLTKLARRNGGLF